MFDWLSGIGKGFQIANVIYKFNKKIGLERHCNQIIVEYELNYNATVEEFRKKFNALPSHEKTVLYKCYPEIEEYLEHCERNPGKVFHPKSLR